MSVFERICETREGDDEAVDSWCKEWEGNGGGRWEEEKEGKKGEVGWEEVVRKAEEVVWLATVSCLAFERRGLGGERRRKLIVFFGGVGYLCSEGEKRSR